MNFLVLGCNGMAGHMISLYLKERGHKVTGFALNKSRYVETIIGDATDFDSLKKIILNGNYDTVINCIGILNESAENNKALAVLLNSYLPHFLENITKDTDIQIIHMSTDCVFSGNKGSYKEDDVRDGETFYDRSKALGELENGKDITLRNSIVGPDINEKGIGLMNWFLKQTNNVNGYTKVMWTGQTTLQLAKTMEVAAQNRAHGLYNMVPDRGISKYELLGLFNNYLRKEPIKINPINNIISDKTLIRTRYEFDYKIPDYEVMIKELSDWLSNHKEMYPHYYL